MIKNSPVMIGIFAILGVVALYAAVKLKDYAYESTLNSKNSGRKSEN
jgi:hypothetical protein